MTPRRRTVIASVTLPPEMRFAQPDPLLFTNNSRFLWSHAARGVQLTLLRHKNCDFSTEPNLGKWRQGSALTVSSLTFVEARAVVDLGLQRLVRVSGGRAHLPGCLEHDVVPAHRGTLLTILSGCLKVNRTYSIYFIYIY